MCIYTFLTLFILDLYFTFDIGCSTTSFHHKNPLFNSFMNLDSLS